MVVLIAVGTGVFVFFQVRTDPVKDTVNAGQNLVVDIIVEHEHHPLVNEVVFYNPISRKTAFMDVPPDTGGLLPSLGRVDGIAALYHPEKMRPYLDQLGSWLGTPVPFYLILDTHQLSATVDLLTGIELFISSSLELTQTTPLYLLPSGNNRLDGPKVIQYLLAPREGEDLADRASRYQRLVQAWLRQLGAEKNFLLRPEVFPYLWKNVASNFEDVGMKTFIQVCATADWERTVMQRVLGTDRDVDGKILLFPHYNGTLLKDSIRQILEVLPRKDGSALLPSSVTIEILNGTKQPGLATRTSLLLKSFGYNVVAVRNADNTNQDNTVIVDRKGTQEAARKVADIIQCRKLITSQETTPADADVIITLGKDFDGRYVR
ncbi:MAG: LCP family protein [Spirochaetales bacterium]|nr:LCP family protein [Spirochaetales bacterium]